MEAERASWRVAFDTFAVEALLANVDRDMPNDRRGRVCGRVCGRGFVHGWLGLLAARADSIMSLVKSHIS